MKKLALLALVAWGLFYAEQKDMLPAWVPIPKMPSQTKLDIPPPRLNAPDAVAPRAGQVNPERPATREPIGNSRWMDQQQKRLDQQNADRQRRAEWDLTFRAQCDAARANLGAASVVDRGRGAFELKQGSKVLSESERAAVRAENEKFIQENCRP
jgi:hypothetical protein